MEDTSVTLDILRDTFGEDLYRIVMGASEPDKALPWEERKRHTLDFLKGAAMDIKFVSLADKLSNIRAIAADYLEVGDKLWVRFNRGRDDQKGYYKGLVQVLHDDSANEEYKALHKQFKQKVKEVFDNKP